MLCAPSAQCYLISSSIGSCLPPPSDMPCRKMPAQLPQPSLKFAPLPAVPSMPTTSLANTLSNLIESGLFGNQPKGNLPLLETLSTEHRLKSCKLICKRKRAGRSARTWYFLRDPNCQIKCLPILPRSWEFHGDVKSGLPQLWLEIECNSWRNWSPIRRRQAIDFSMLL